jgi:hypothetical protein
MENWILKMGREGKDGTGFLTWTFMTVWMEECRLISLCLRMFLDRKGASIIDAPGLEAFFK